MDSKEYVKSSGVLCPNCEKSAVEGQDVTIDEGFAYQECYCTECEATWTDVYKLSHYRALEVQRVAS